ncbi:31908_t:CDS:2, partial [Gigaspora margarita]
MSFTNRKKKSIQNTISEIMELIANTIPVQTEMDQLFDDYIQNDYLENNELKQYEKVTQSTGPKFFVGWVSPSVWHYL